MEKQTFTPKERASLKEKLSTKRVTVGFDGCIDSIYRLVKNKGETNEYYSKIKDFGDFITSKDNLSGSVEIVNTSTKIGGNAVILSNTIASLGAHVNCMATMGCPDVEPIFLDMHQNCTKYTIGKQALCNALEFDNGKIMLSDMGFGEDITYDNLVSKLGFDNLLRLYGDADFIAFVNWSELSNTTKLFEEILSKVFPLIPKRQRAIFFDLSDPTGRSTPDILKILEIIKKFSSYGDVILSLNENEARILYKTLSQDALVKPVKNMGEYLQNHLKIHMIIIHPRHCAYAFSPEGNFFYEGALVSEPLITTGGGDNFNGGLISGLLMGLDVTDALALGCITSENYVKSGFSPSLDTVFGGLYKA